jgi:thiol:disulfide interchange protein
LVLWRPLDGAEAAAVTERKPLLYDFSAAWCEPCRRMESELFADGASADFINKTYVAVRVTEEDSSPAAAAVRARYGIEALPTLVVTSPARRTPLRERGYPGKRRTMTFLHAAAAAPGSDGVPSPTAGLDPAGR